MLRDGVGGWEWDTLEQIPQKAKTGRVSLINETNRRCSVE